MRRQIRIILATLLCFVLLDGLVAIFLATVAPGSLVRFFEYGRSVPGKLEAWEMTPKAPGNLQAVAWMPEMIEDSAEKFASEDPGDGPVFRVYGLSFVNHILDAAQEVDPTLILDKHSGPGAPPNFTYAAFLDDRANRREGDIVVFGILSSALAPMASCSNSSWAFEQPAPFTYPIFTPAQEQGLNRTDPILRSYAQYQAEGYRDPQWQEQLASQDRLFSPVATALAWLDLSPFARLVRRSLALDDISQKEAEVLSHPYGAPYPYGEALTQMAKTFAQTVRADGQIPIVMLIQSRDQQDPDLLALLGDMLAHENIPYFATAEHQDTRDPRAFLGDGHYTHEVNIRFGKAFLKLPSVANHLN